MNEKPKIWRRWMRFKLRTLLVLTAFAAALFAWVASERRQSQYERQVAEQLRERGFTDVRVGSPFYSLEVEYRGEGQGWWRTLASQMLGERIYCVWNPTLHDFHDAQVLASLTNLQMLQLDMTKVNDLTPLADLQTLQMLWMVDLPVRDLGPLKNLQHLQRLDLSFTKVNDLAPLAGLSRLELLTLSNTSVTKDQVETLQQSLPNCQIDYDSPP